MKYDINHYPRNNSRVITMPTDSVDIFNFTELSASLMGLVENTSEKRVVIDLNLIKYIDSVGVGLLTKLREKALLNRGNMAIACGNADILKVFRILNIDRSFDIYDTVEEAAGSFSGELSE